MSDRFVAPVELPSSLWEPHLTLAGTTAAAIVLPPELQAAYRSLLSEMGLLELASDMEQRLIQGEIGNEGQDGAERHFALRFLGSCGRVQLFAMDPNSTFRTSLDALILLMSGGLVRILDIPSGSGAASALLISLIAELRATDRLPRVDLFVRVVGGESNSFASGIADKLFQRLNDWWLSCGIVVTWSFSEWDVLSNESTTELLDRWRPTVEPQTKYMVVGANFSGFLDQSVPNGPRNVNRAVPSLSNVFSRAGVLGSSAFWIEPNGNSGRRTLSSLNGLVFAGVRRLATKTPPNVSSQSRIVDPVIDNSEIRVTARGIHLGPV